MSKCGKDPMTPPPTGTMEERARAWYFREQGEPADEEDEQIERLVKFVREEVAALTKERDAAREDADRLAGALKDATDKEPCYFDHRGSCQTHCDLSEDGTCFMGNSRNALAAHERAVEGRKGE